MIHLIVNQTAGRGRALQQAGAVANAMRERGHPVRVTTAPPATAARACAADDIVIACGGDGTVHAVVQECMRRDLILGVLPTGRGNDIARALRVAKLSIEEQVARWCTNAPRRIDVAYVPTYGEWYLGVLTSGFDSRVNARANRERGGYAVAMVRELRSFGPVPYRVTIDDTTIADQALLVSVGNGGWYGAGMQICPDADITDGWLDVTWVKAVPVIRFLRLFPAVYRGAHGRRPEVRTYRARRVSISAADQIAFADGEHLGPLPVEITVQPGALRAFVGPS